MVNAKLVNHSATICFSYVVRLNTPSVLAWHFICSLFDSIHRHVYKILENRRHTFKIALKWFNFNNHRQVASKKAFNFVLVISIFLGLSFFSL